ncbi:pyridine nucleotide-disulfide oxidoreductase [Methylobacterium sp. Leaf469]|uniref:NAD(P)/FAD-dependent oxidoreductase n=1 Tax=unclassified Methylobacterium TaxID=2615210 RepID=UPI00070224CC|nr:MULTISPECIES: FAD-dependent oxidoreductase [unclassified Methylobacterium]KQP36911.1 pyridine nucleotide-disulfide oxidoreductase [Methylobacterium sp. Leaf100]KQP72129.1 pyridine nucleotide-disulfide oxidoreductase [Methylobacterium sp. Leaf112]KQU05593.1 pyridine nucleotide-disulfide oxidoreductase [Methylobacterium sp. Leaf469]USU33622.1 FAD-dependent oxidoreductase [Methylobacterium sp. OTU13CASTA1]
MSAGVVVVGAGQAGFQLAASLREAGYADPITLLGDEPDLPYQRPPLSKAYLAGKTDASGLELRPAAYFSDHRIHHRPSVRIDAIDRAARRVLCADGTAVAYDHLVLATGARNRALPVPGADLAGVFQLRGRADADGLKAALADARSVAVVGAGFIGLEFAGICAARGLSVTVLESAERPMARAVSAETASFFTRAHGNAGIRFLFGAGVTAIEGEKGAETVRLRDGSSLAADLVLVGIGVIPNQALAEAAGLAVGDGVHVDAFLATDDPAVSAIGDCARAPSRFADGASVRIESVQNALDQGRCLAARLVGRPAAYDAVPWFWSDQGPHKLQIAGLSAPSDAAVARPVASGLCVFRFREGRLSAVETVDRPGDHMAARRILAQGRTLSPTAAADPAHDLKALATGR